MMITNLFFSRLIQICGELFFQNGFSTLVSFYEDISKWYIHHLPFHSSRPFPKVGDQLSLHACNHVCFVWQTRTGRLFLWRFHKISQPSKSSNSIKKNGRKTIPNSIPIHGLSLRLWESPMNLDLNINALTLSRPWTIPFPPFTTIQRNSWKKLMILSGIESIHKLMSRASTELDLDSTGFPLFPFPSTSPSVLSTATVAMDSPVCLGSSVAPSESVNGPSLSSPPSLSVPTHVIQTMDVSFYLLFLFLEFCSDLLPLPSPPLQVFGLGESFSKDSLFKGRDLSP